MKMRYLIKVIVIFLSLYHYSCSSSSTLNYDDYINQCNGEFVSISELFFSGDFLKAKNSILSYNQLDTIAFNYESYAFLAECYKQIGKEDSGKIVFKKNILENLKERRKKLYKNIDFANEDLENWYSKYPDFPGELQKENGFVSGDILPEPIAGVSQIQKNVVYPDHAKEGRLKGKVYVGTLINEKGDAIDFHFYKSLSEEYDRAAIDAIKRTKFIAPKRKGRPCKMWITIPLVYN